MADAEERGFLKAIKEDAADVASRLAYADWLEEHGRRHDAIKQRVAANVSSMFYKIRRKSDGLYADGRGGWSAKGYEWRLLSVLKGHVTSESHYQARGYGSGGYSTSEWNDLEIAVFEVPLRPTVVLALSGEPGGIILNEVKPGGSES